MGIYLGVSVHARERTRVSVCLTVCESFFLSIKSNSSKMISMKLSRMA